MIVEEVSLCHTEQGVYITDANGKPWTRAMWLTARKSIDAYFDTKPDEKIALKRQDYPEKLASSEEYSHSSHVVNDPKPKAHIPGFIYLFHGDGTNWYKIGISAKPIQRARILSTKAPFPVVIISCYGVGDMKNTEAWWHETFAHKRVHGEWFELDEYDVDLFVAQEGRPIS